LCRSYANDRKNYEEVDLVLEGMLIKYFILIYYVLNFSIYF
jgi:hypothetical protein